MASHAIIFYLEYKDNNIAIMVWFVSLCVVKHINIAGYVFKCMRSSFINHNA